jgi:ubiquinone/menaquinone biosynthesis C-methylase UbiE
MLAAARRRLEGLPNVRFARGEGTSMPAVPGGSVDLAYALLVLQHLEREDAFALLRDLRRALRPGGRAFLTFPNLLSDAYLTAFVEQVDGGEVANPARARAYTPQEVERLLPAAGLPIERLDAGVEIVAVCRA